MATKPPTSYGYTRFCRCFQRFSMVFLHLHPSPQPTSAASEREAFALGFQRCHQRKGGAKIETCGGRIIWKMNLGKHYGNVYIYIYIWKVMAIKFFYVLMGTSMIYQWTRTHFRTGPNKSGTFFQQTKAAMKPLKPGIIRNHR